MDDPKKKIINLRDPDCPLYMNIEEFNRDLAFFERMDWICMQCLFQDCSPDDPALIKAADEKFGKTL